MKLINTPMYTLYGWHKHCFTWQAEGKLDVCSNSGMNEDTLFSICFFYIKFSFSETLILSLIM